MPINGRDKGKKAELDICHKVEAWWRQLPIEVQNTPDGQPAQFIRTPGSGGWGTAQTRNNYRVAGDVSSTSASWPFTVEAKRREGWSLTVLVKGGHRGSPVWAWWQQCCSAAQVEGGVPMLWVRRNRQPWLVLMPEVIAIPRLGIPIADIYWPDPVLTAKHNRTGVHPVGYLAEKVLASDPAAWLGLRKAGAPVLATAPRVVPRGQRRGSQGG